jgi:hypothetical protein
MKKLYKATFHAVIYATEEEEAWEIADNMETNCLMLDRDDIPEITTAEEVPRGWVCADNYPATACARVGWSQGELHDDTIKELLERSKIPIPVTSAESILELKNEIVELKKTVEALAKKIKR